jgi:hypothetical protein
MEGEPSFVVTGTGHHGSGFVAEVLWRCGVRCGHEQWFTVDGEELVEGLHGDSSWLALCGDRLERFDGRVFHQVRYPLLCIGSLAEYFECAEPDHYLSARLDLIGGRQGSALYDAARCWLLLNLRAATFAEATWRVESISPWHLVTLAHTAGVDLDIDSAGAALAETATNVNSHGRRQVTWNDLSQLGMEQPVRLAAAAWGYRV